MTIPTVTMLAPHSFGGTIISTPSGTTYVPNASGQVSVLHADIATLASLGFTIVTDPPSVTSLPLSVVLTFNAPVGTAFGVGVFPQSGTLSVADVKIIDSEGGPSVSWEGAVHVASNGYGYDFHIYMQANEPPRITNFGNPIIILGGSSLAILTVTTADTVGTAFGIQLTPKVG